MPERRSPLGSSLPFVFDLYGRSLPRCCVLCLGPPDTSTNFIHHERGFRNLQERAYVYTLELPLCSLCARCRPGKIVECEERDKLCSLRFLNPRFGIMTMDRAWLATQLPACRAIFAG